MSDESFTLTRTTEPKEAPPRRRLPRLNPNTFDSLQYRDYRLMWFGRIGSAMAQQAEMLTRTWLILELTDSAVMIGLVHLTRAIGSIGITPIAGVLADRIDRRYILIASNLLNAAFFLLLAALYITDLIEVWHVVASAIVAGAAMTVQQTGLQAVIPNLVPRDKIMNATSLQSVLMGSSRIMGPSMAGVMLATTGVAGSYILMTVFLVLPVVMYLAMKPIKVEQRPGQVKVPFWQSFREGMAFAVKEPAVRVVMIVSITTITFGMPFLQLMPLYVKEILDRGPATVGLIMAVPGVLTIAGGLFAASLGDYKYKGRLLFLAVLSPAAAAIIMSQTDLVVTTLLAACIFGALSSQYQPTTQTAVMKATPDALRGRVASLIAMVNNLGSVGVLFYGLTSDQVGIQNAYLIFGLLVAGLQIFYFTVMKSYRQLN